MKSPIEVGSAVVATRDGGHDAAGLPKVRPIAGRTYRVTGIYRMSYGLGCTLQGMSAAPYRGYLLFVKSGHKVMLPGWYFKPIAVADSEWTQAFREYLGSKSYESVCDEQVPHPRGHTP